jgi:hypothetical protein
MSHAIEFGVDIAACMPPNCSSLATPPSVSPVPSSNLMSDLDTVYISHDSAISRQNGRQSNLAAQADISLAPYDNLIDLSPSRSVTSGDNRRCSGINGSKPDVGAGLLPATYKIFDSPLTSSVYGGPPQPSIDNGFCKFTASSSWQGIVLN